MQVPIKQIILEFGLVFGPALVPQLQRGHAHAKLAGVQNKQELKDFKNDYSGYANYRDYDKTSHNIGRGAVYGTGAGAVLGGLVATDEDVRNNEPEMIAGLGMAPILLGTLGGAATGVIHNNILKSPSLYSEVKRKENELRKVQQ